MAHPGAVTLGIAPDTDLLALLARAGLTEAPPWLRRAASPEPRWVSWETADGAGDGPAGVVLATVDADRMESDLAELVDDGWEDAGEDAVLGTRCRRSRGSGGVFVLAEPTTEGYAAACLARFGEGPIAVALRSAAVGDGKRVLRNPVDDGPAAYVRLGPRTGPTLILLDPS